MQDSNTEARTMIPQQEATERYEELKGKVSQLRRYL
jgi:hypothetical protein